MFNAYTWPVKIDIKMSFLGNIFWISFASLVACFHLFWSSIITYKRKFPLNSTWPSDWSLFSQCAAATTASVKKWFWALFSLADLRSGDTVFLSLLQESPSLWHFMTTRQGQKMTSASRKEKGSRLSTARKSLQLLITQPGLGKNVSFQFDPWRCCCEGSRLGIVFQLS